MSRLDDIITSLFLLALGLIAVLGTVAVAMVAPSLFWAVPLWVLVVLETALVALCLIQVLGDIP